MLTDALREQIISIIDDAQDMTIATVREDGYSHRADRAEMDRLLSMQPVSPSAFDLMVAELPETVRRFFESLWVRSPSLAARKWRSAQIPRPLWRGRLHYYPSRYTAFHRC
jgi:hypothetical protein